MKATFKLLPGKFKEMQCPLVAIRTASTNTLGHLAPTAQLEMEKGEKPGLGEG